MRCAGRKCQCPKGYKGDAEFECVKTKEKLCSVTGEGTVSMEGYGGSASVVNLPCSYLASRFVVRQSGGQSFCGVEVHVTNELQRDNFVARTVHVSVGMTEPARLVQYYTDVMVTGSYDESKSYNYVIRASPLEAFTWGSSTMTDKHQGDILNATVDKEDNFVVLDLPTCETRVKFRAYDSTRNAQGQLPGVSIAAPEHAEFVHEVGDYPYSLCGRSKDPKQLYRNRAKDLRLNGPSDAIIWDILSQQPHQFDNPEAEQCERAMELFAASSDQRAHFKACSFVLSKKRLRGCLKKNGLSPIEVFNSCLSYLQLPTDAHACQELKSASGSCRNLWNGPKTYSCQ
nr:hypothetical protein BaRGS_021493 [Batillaria attramentaria]